MPTNKKPRKAYRPKYLAPLQDTITYVMESVASVTSRTHYIGDIAIRNHSAMAELVGGRASTRHVGILVGLSNMVAALNRMKIGTEYSAVARAGEDALASLVERAWRINRYTPTGPEINAINALIELHDAQMEIITVGQMDQAIAVARQLQRSGLARALPTIGELK